MLKAHSLMHLMTDERRLVAAARDSMRRCSAPGPDGISWRQYRRSFRENIAQLGARLTRHEWRPSGVRLKEITEFSGKSFPIAIPTVEDRIVHRAMRRCIEIPLEAGALASFVSGY